MYEKRDELVNFAAARSAIDRREEEEKFMETVKR